MSLRTDIAPFTGEDARRMEDRFAVLCDVMREQGAFLRRYFTTESPEYQAFLEASVALHDASSISLLFTRHFK